MKKAQELIFVTLGSDDVLRSPGEKPELYFEGNLWDVGCYEFSNRMALKAARFIAKFNNYELKKIKEAK